MDPETGFSTRLLDFLKALDQVVDYALQSKVDLVLFCGDAYRSREPTQTHQREFAIRLHRLAASGIPVFLLAGNHDLPNAFGRATAVEIFDTLSVANIHVAGGRPGIQRLETAAGPIQVAAVPWARRSLLMGKEAYRNLTFQQTNDRLQEIVTGAIREMADALDPAVPSVLAAHLSVSTATFGSEKSTMVGQEPVLLPGSVFLPEFDYIALGHIHRHQVLSEQPYGAYAGSLERIDFSEEREEKGFCTVEISGGPTPRQRSVEFAFHPVQGRRFLTIPVEIREGGLDQDDPTAAVLRAIERRRAEVPGAIVRLQVSLPVAAQARLRENEVHKALAEAQHVLPFSIQLTGNEPRIRLRDMPEAEGISPLDALRAYLNLKKCPPERAKVLLQYGERLLRDYQAKEE